MLKDFRKKPAKLPWHQWWVGYALILTILFFVLVSQFSRAGLFRQEVGTPGYLKSRYFEVTVKGAVQFPGTYVLPKGTDMKRLLQRAKAHPEADIDSLLEGSKLYDGQVVKVKKRAMITVYLQGAVENPGGYRLPKGSRAKELKKVARLLEGADPAPLLTKKKLKDGQVVAIHTRALKNS